jgi:hypothetical protein
MRARGGWAIWGTPVREPFSPAARLCEHLLRKRPIGVRELHMQEWRLELFAGDPAIFARLVQMLDARDVMYSAETPNRIIVEGEHASDVEELLDAEIYDSVFGPHFHLTCDDADSEQETRYYMEQHAIPFVEHRFDGDVAFVISRQHDPDNWT